MSIYFATCLYIFYFAKYHFLLYVYYVRNITPLGTTDREPRDVKRKAAVRGRRRWSDLR